MFQHIPCIRVFLTIIKFGEKKHLFESGHNVLSKTFGLQIAQTIKIDRAIEDRVDPFNKQLMLKSGQWSQTTENKIPLPPVV